MPEQNNQSESIQFQSLSTLVDADKVKNMICGPSNSSWVEIRPINYDIKNLKEQPLPRLIK